jgi:hypothetical protein
MKAPKIIRMQEHSGTGWNESKGRSHTRRVAPDRALRAETFLSLSRLAVLS